VRVSTAGDGFSTCKTYDAKKSWDELVW